MSDRLEMFRKMVEASPGDVMGRYLYGSELLKEKRFDDAAHELREAVRLKPDYSAAWRDLGKALVGAGRAEEARSVYKEGIEVAGRQGDLQTVKEMEVFLKRLGE